MLLFLIIVRTLFCWFFKYSNFSGFNSGSLSIIGLEDYEQLNNYHPEDFTHG